MERIEFSTAEFDENQGVVMLKGITDSGKQIIVKRASDNNYLIHYSDSETPEGINLKIDWAWGEQDRQGNVNFFVASKLKGLRETDEDKLEEAVQSKFADLKVVDEDLYNQALPVTILFRKTGSIWATSPLNKYGTPMMDGEIIHRS